MAESATATKAPAPIESTKAQPALAASDELARATWPSVSSGASSRAAAAAAAEVDPRSLVWLQRNAGNRAVLQAIGSRPRRPHRPPESRLPPRTESLPRTRHY